MKVIKDFLKHFMYVFFIVVCVVAVIAVINAPAIIGSITDNMKWLWLYLITIPTPIAIATYERS